MADRKFRSKLWYFNNRGVSGWRARAETAITATNCFPAMIFPVCVHNDRCRSNVFAMAEKIDEACDLYGPRRV